MKRTTKLQLHVDPLDELAAVARDLGDDAVEAEVRALRERLDQGLSRGPRGGHRN